MQRVLKTAVDGTTTMIADTTGPQRNLYFDSNRLTTPAINDQRLAAFVATRHDRRGGIYTGNGGELRMVDDVLSVSVDYRI